MTRTVPIVLALSLLINEVHLLFDASILKDRYLESNLVYLLSTSLLLKEYVNVIPSKLHTSCPLACFILELLLSLVILECSLVYVWNIVQHYLLQHSDDLLVYLSDDQGLDWVVCHLCCGQTNCSEIFAALVLKVASLALLLVVCCYTGIK